MEFIAYEMQYTSDITQNSTIDCVSFDKKFFSEYMKIYNECFYEMRKSLDRKPYNFLSEYAQIANYIENIHLLIIDGEIIGSVACYGNEIDDLIVNKKYQHQGYGRELLLWAIERIRKSNNDPITLHVADWNKNALKLYKNVGFVITNTEIIR